ncbi:YkvA family protein [Tissierellaceae bacterium HCP3S3_D8]
MKIDIEEIIRRLDAKANTIYYDDERIMDLINKVKEKIENNEVFADIIDDIKTAIEMIVDWKNGEYPHLSKNTVIIVIIGFLYLLNPFDIVPDFLKMGFLDDLIVIVYILKKIKDELKVYRAWKGSQISSGDIPRIKGNIDIETP